MSSGPLLCGSGCWSLSSSFLSKRPLWECEDVQEASVGPGGGLPLRQEACGDRWVRQAGARSRGSGFVGLWRGVGPAAESLSAIGRLGRGPSVCGQGERPVVATRPRAAGVGSGPRGLGARVRPAAGESGRNRVAKGTAPWAAPGGGRSCLLGDGGELTSGHTCLAGDGGPPSIEALQKRPLPTSALCLPSSHLLYFLLCLKTGLAKFHCGRPVNICIPPPLC